MSHIPEERTDFGFRDITGRLLAGRLPGEQLQLEKYDVVRAVLLDREKVQTHAGGLTSKIYYFYSRDYRMRGRVFPNDEVVAVGDTVDIIIQNFQYQNGDLDWNVDAHIFHELRVGELLKIRIPNRNTGRDPAFKIFNQMTGFVRPGGQGGLFARIKTGCVVVVEIMSMTGRERIHPLVKPVQIIE